MKHGNSRLLSFLLGAASVLTAGAALILFSTGISAVPVILYEPADPAATVESFFDSICQGNYGSASDYCLTPLPEDAPPADEDAAALYAAVCSRRSWEFCGESFMQNGSAYYEVSFTYPDANALTDGLDQEVQAELEKRVDEAAHASDIYTETGEYREDVVLEVWDAVLSARLEQADSYLTTVTLPVSLTLEGHQWYIRLSDELLSALRAGL